MAVKQNFSMFRGCDYVLRVTLTGTGTIAGWLITFTMRLSPGSATALIEKTVGAGIVITDPILREIEITITDEDTIGLTPGKYAYDCKRMTSGAEGVLTYGTLTLLPEVTR
jgi:hypothetical protein